MANANDGHSDDVSKLVTSLVSSRFDDPVADGAGGRVRGRVRFLSGSGILRDHPRPMCVEQQQLVLRRIRSLSNDTTTNKGQHQHCHSCRERNDSFTSGDEEGQLPARLPGLAYLMDATKCSGIHRRKSSSCSSCCGSGSSRNSPAVSAAAAAAATASSQPSATVPQRSSLLLLSADLTSSRPTAVTARSAGAAAAVAAAVALGSSKVTPASRSSFCPTPRAAAAATDAAEEAAAAVSNCLSPQEGESCRKVRIDVAGDRDSEEDEETNSRGARNSDKKTKKKTRRKHQNKKTSATAETKKKMERRLTVSKAEISVLDDDQEDSEIIDVVGGVGEDAELKQQQSGGSSLPDLQIVEDADEKAVSDKKPAVSVAKQRWRDAFVKVQAAQAEGRIDPENSLFISEPKDLEEPTPEEELKRRRAKAHVQWKAILRRLEGGGGEESNLLKKTTDGIKKKSDKLREKGRKAETALKGQVKEQSQQASSLIKERSRQMMKDSHERSKTLKAKGKEAKDKLKARSTSVGKSFVERSRERWEKNNNNNTESHHPVKANKAKTERDRSRERTKNLLNNVKETDEKQQKQKKTGGKEISRFFYLF